MTEQQHEPEQEPAPDSNDEALLEAAAALDAAAGVIAMAYSVVTNRLNRTGQAPAPTPKGDGRPPAQQAPSVAPAGMGQDPDADPLDDGCTHEKTITWEEDGELMAMCRACGRDPRHEP